MRSIFLYLEIILKFILFKIQRNPCPYLIFPISITKLKSPFSTKIKPNLFLVRINCQWEIPEIKFPFSTLWGINREIGPGQILGVSFLPPVGLKGRCCGPVPRRTAPVATGMLSLSLLSLSTSLFGWFKVQDRTDMLLSPLDRFLFADLHQEHTPGVWIPSSSLGWLGRWAPP